MSPSERPTQFGRIHPPDEAWLARQPPEPILEPDLPIIDTHHHLWDRGGHRYFLPDFLADAAIGGVLGYGAYAGRQKEVFAAWKPRIEELAACPNVVVKLGGMMMRLAAFDYRTAPRPPASAELAALWRPYMETCIERFGADRCMFESNFPVDKMGIGWAGLWNALKRIAGGASAAGKQAMFSGTARRVYRLDT
ncbi:MAG TPA: amidohydrolase family protein [Methylomirabilota bacterium]|nr:amidohydrolase family protein [Methylomirabilota bacterium]